MDPARMLARCPHSPFKGTGWLVGWRLTFGGEEYGLDGAMATIVEDPTGQVFVCLYDVTSEDEKTLALWEMSLFRKIRLRAQTLDQEESVWLYVLEAYEGGLPSASYLSLLSEAADAAGAPDDYTDDLRNRPCRSVSG
jgi:hypothetical protein